MKIFSSKRRVAVAATLVLLALFLFRPGASQLKSKIIASLSAAVGRPVDVGSVHIRMLPRPGFEMENLVIYDDASFSSEPMLRASEVAADLRLSSLLRGRLEMAKLDLTEPSLNLVRRSGGGWNLQSVLERAARTPLAPTGKAKSEPRPGFPYIEGSSGRVNFKNGPEKKPYALTNADFALWQESDNTWGVRLKAQPFRSDMNLNDTGLLQVSGTWQRAESFRDTPLQFNVEWAHAQLGQVSKFITGYDKGWRGEILLEASITGTPERLKITSTVSADDFRRYDITSGNPLRLAARCEGEYSTNQRAFHDIDCNAPAGTGRIRITGEAGLPGSREYSLTLTAQNLPANALGALARHMKKDVPADLELEGTLQGRLSISADTGHARARGQGEIGALRVSSASEKAELGPIAIPIVVSGLSTSNKVKTRSPQGTRLELGPFALERGRAGSATVRGWVDRTGYQFNVAGDAEVGRTLRLARMVGLRSLSTAAEGAVQLNLQVAGLWAAQGGTAAFAGPEVTGSAKLKNVRFSLRNGGEHVDISSVELQFLPDAVHAAKLTATAAGAVWRGSLELPRGCGMPENCPIHFQLNTDLISLNDVNTWVNPNPKNRPWYRVLGAAQSPSMLGRVQASGRATADHIVLHGVTASKISASVSLDSGKLELTAIDADLLGGKHQGHWQADFTVKPPMCSGSGSLTGISLENVSSLMKDDWIEGTAGVSYEVRGECASDFWQSSVGTLQVNVTNGNLLHVFLEENATVLKIRKLNAQARLRAGEIEISDGRLDSPDGRYEVGGTATLNREVDFKLTPVPAGSGNAYSIGGTLAQPHVAAVNRAEQARLKTPAK